MTLVCKKCLTKKDVADFHKRKDTPSGYRKECKECRNTKAKNSYDKDSTKKKEYIKKNKKSIKDRMDIYYKENKEVLLLQQKRYRASQTGKAISQKVEAKRYLQVRETRDGSITDETLRLLYEAQDGRCYICNCDLTQLKRRNQHLDHIVPLILGGKHILENVAWSCANCNFLKGGK